MPSNTVIQHLALGAIGLAFGFVLSRAGFADFGEIHLMFTFADLRLLLAFAGAVVIIAAVYLALGRRWQEPRAVFTRGTIPGGLLFGAGWALTGACPSVVLVQLANGHLMALATLLGILLGTAIYPAINEKYLHISSGGCGL